MKGGVDMLFRSGPTYECSRQGQYWIGKKV